MVRCEDADYRFSRPDVAEEDLMRCVFCFLLVLCLALSSCAAKSGSNEELPPLEDSSSAAAVPDDPDGVYEDFSDILVPIELTRLADESFVFESPQFKTGYMAYDGRVEFNSLVDYFINNMTKDGWTTQSTLRAGDSALVFDKPGKSALIRVIDGSYKTKVIIIAVERKAAAAAPPMFESETVIMDSDDVIVDQESGLTE